MDLKSLKARGADLSASQQGAFYHARRRRRARENAGAAQFKVKGVRLGMTMKVTLTAQ